MESENGVAMEDEKHVIGETTKESPNKEAENNPNAEMLAKNEVSEPTTEPESHNSAESKIPKRSKVYCVSESFIINETVTAHMA